VNLALTMLLGGLWHGAAVHYVAWGAYQGAWLILERLLGKAAPYERSPAAVRVLLTFLVVMIGWVIFRAETLPAAGRHLAAMFGAGPAADAGGWLGNVQPRPLAIAALAVALAITWTCRTTQELLARPRPALSAFAAIAFVCALCQLLFQSYSPFLYFQF
jgi:alginate O-acetyltransferase complex protein AlgI